MNDLIYNNWYAMSDENLSKKIGEFVKHHRLQQNKTQSVIATQANISRSTLSLLERGETVTLSTLLRVLRVLEVLYVLDVFKVTQTISPIQLAKMQQNQRKRASGNIAAEEDLTDW
ncbi:helix-turn-helix domain-containing protein [Polaribacter porphyrae]|uniref:Transcriptional regulator n=1 Tax=Polaribacter porphyrae TaxID=1137780 RepID=A0A2S7WNC9_9FLAO|nr:helix-turn-helix transcriptional regulator [Polaribacter porphyrae]PQJ78956.1 transcriptional regulator [Polaribacter porphyrae]